MIEYYYFDSDACVKLLIPEVGHSLCKSIYDNSDNVIIISNLTIVEVHSALSKCRNTGEISAKAYSEAIRYFNAIIIGEETGDPRASVKVVEINSDHFRDATALVDETKTLFPGDSLQVSVALVYKDLPLKMVSGDSKIIRIAGERGLAIVNVNECLCPNCGNKFNFTTSNKICDKCGHTVGIISDATCTFCGEKCTYCAHPKWCEKIRKNAAS